MLHRQFIGRPVKIGVGANRAAVAARFFERYGYIDSCSSNYLERLCLGQNVGSHLPSEKIGTIILDDGMQVELYKFNISFSFSFYCWEIGSYL